MSIDPIELVPHRRPFLFLDVIDEVDAEHAVGRYRFRPDESFFAGHFPNRPIVPGVIQIEAMAQLMVAVGAFGAKQEGRELKQVYFTLADQCRFHRPLGPGDEVRIEARRDWTRLGSIQAHTRVLNASGDLVAEAVLRGTAP